MRALDKIKLRGFTTALGEHLPLLTEETGTSVQLSSPDGQVEVPVTNGETFPRWSSRDKRTVLTLRQNILSLETTDYPGILQRAGIAGESSHRLGTAHGTEGRHQNRPTLHRRDPRAL